MYAKKKAEKKVEIITWFGLGFVVLCLVLFAWWYFRGGDIQQPKQQLQPAEWQDNQVTVGWIGHSTLLINLYGYRILTDPVFGEKVGVSVGFTQIGLKRFTAPALSIDEVGSVDLILLSHAHMDHFDMPTLRKLANPETTVITARGTTGLLRKLPFAKVEELGGKESLTLGDVTIQAVPVRHWGNRFPWNRSYQYTGYVIERNGTSIFFPGDTAYTPDFKWLADKQLDLAFMPIGAYSPDQFQRHHCTPEQAWQMFLDTGAKWLIPIHWNTFVLSREPVEEPLQRLLAIAGDDQKRIVLTEQGKSFTL